jgi:hypothetical protein
MLSQLIYVSKRDRACTEEEIEKILSACERNNKEKDITGVLLYSPTHFVQYLEGNYNEISRLYKTIIQDPRHKDAVMLGNSPIESRSFPSWQMGAKKFNDFTIEYASEMHESELNTFQRILDGKNSANSEMIAVIKKFFR